jgi:DNA-binding IscR family transcriptional regulator
MDEKEDSYMRISSKTSIGIHIMILVALYGDKCKLTGAIISRSTGTNPVITRNLLSDLQNAGLINIPRGVGGSQLAKPLNSISIYDIFEATDAEKPKDIIAIHTNPHPDCPVGSIIQNVLEDPYERIGDAITQAMKKEMLIDLIQSVKEKRPDWLDVFKPD